VSDYGENVESNPGRKSRVILIAVIASLGVAIAPLWFFWIGPKIKRDALLSHGIRANGVLLRVEETGTSVNRVPELELTTAFTRADGKRDTASTDFVPTMRTLSMYQPGVTVTIAYDSADPHSYTITALNTGDAYSTPGASGRYASPAVNADSLQKFNDSLRDALKALQKQR
jgi:hypothetical protein